jgi:hypothetical protein
LNVSKQRNSQGGFSGQHGVFDGLVQNIGLLPQAHKGGGVEGLVLAIRKIKDYRAYSYD